MKVANNANVTFWGALIMAQTSPNIWGQIFFLAFAAIIVWRVYKESNEQSETNLDNTGRGESGCTNGACEQPIQPKQRRNRTKAAEVPSKE